MTVAKSPIVAFVFFVITGTDGGDADAGRAADGDVAGDDVELQRLVRGDADRAVARPRTSRRASPIVASVVIE